MNIAAEMSMHVKDLVAVRERDDEKVKRCKEGWEEKVELELNSEVRAWLRRLQSLASLWMQPELYRVAYDVQPHEPRFEYIESHCEACVLATIGGSVQAVTDLRTSLIGRHRRGWTSMMWEFVDSWAGWTGCGDEVRAESERVGRMVVRVVRRERGRRRRERRERRHRRERRRGEPDGYPEESGRRSGGESYSEREPDKSGSSSENSIEIADAPRRPGGDEARFNEQEQNLESSLRDHYKNLSRLAVNIHGYSFGEQGLHPALRGPVEVDTPPETFQHRLSKYGSQQIGLSTTIPQMDGAGDSDYHFARDYSHLDTLPQSQPEPNPKPNPYSSSIYSRAPGAQSRTPAQGPFAPMPDPSSSSTRIPKPVVSTEDCHRAEQRAMSYRKLVGIPEPSESSEQERDPDPDPYEALPYLKSFHKHINTDLHPIQNRDPDPFADLGPPPSPRYTSKPSAYPFPSRYVDEGSDQAGERAGGESSNRHRNPTGKGPGRRRDREGEGREAGQDGNGNRSGKGKETAAGQAGQNAGKREIHRRKEDDKDDAKSIVTQWGDFLKQGGSKWFVL